MTIVGRIFFSLVAAVAVAIAATRLEIAHAQGQAQPGRSIGTVTTQGNLIVMTLHEGALGAANMFDLSGRTLRFTPDGAAYRAENVALQWDAEFGPTASGPQVTLKNFAFPFSGRSWDSFSVGVTGSISFAAAPAPAPGAAPAGGGRGGGGGVSIGRFDQLQQAARNLVNTVPAICVFMKPRMSGQRFVKELADRVVITWSLTEPLGGIQDFTWVPTVNRFQAVLHKTGAVDLSYEQVAAKDAIVGLYPLVDAGAAKPIAALSDPADSAAPAHLDVRNVRLAAVDGMYLNVTLETRGPVLAEGNSALAGVLYEVTLNVPKQAIASEANRPELVWTIRGGVGGGRGGRGGRAGGGGAGGGAASGATRYIASGGGVQPTVTVRGRTISVQGLLPPTITPGAQVDVSAVVSTQSGVEAPVTVDSVAPKAVTLKGLQRPDIDLSSVTRADGPFAMAYEAFHYLALPNARDLTCTVINALGDHFDFLAYYSDFRVDNQEAGTPSTGPLGGGPDGGAVTGIGANQRALASYCTKGRFQWQFVQPVYVGSNQMQERPPDTATSTSPQQIATYRYQLGERTPDRRMLPYNYAISQIAHEMGHRWSAFVSARVGAETIPLGPTHWARGLHAPAAFPYQRPSEASAMGGGVWQDNFDGTFTQLDDDYYVPATGWSYLELYLMGLITASEVPDFFILRNLVAAGRDANGRPIFKADRTKVTVQDVIAVEGPRLPDVDRSQKKFNTGMVVIVEHGKTLSAELIARANAVATQWIDYFATTTGQRASMTVTVK
jgi:hypothetical protein